MSNDRLSIFFSQFNQLIPVLRQNGMKESQIEEMQQGLKRKMQEIPDPTIAFIGFTGVGKSSTLNALFNAGQEVSDVRACTQFAQSFTGKIEKYTGTKGSINIYDMPGLGESKIKDRQHYQTYEKVLPNVDVIVWMFTASDRSMTPMQEAIETLISRIGTGFTKHLVFVVNKADTTAPGETAWNNQFNVPSEEQKKNIEEFEKYILERVHEVLPKWKGSVITYSAKRRYHLEQLMTAMVQAMPEKYSWVLGDRADIANYFDLIDPEYRDYITSLLEK